MLFPILVYYSMVCFFINPINSTTVNISVCPVLLINKDFKDMLRTQLQIDSGYYYCEAQNWSKDKPDAFAGVHSQVGLLLSFDEASGKRVPSYHTSVR
jgi:hypothetical protein